MQSIQIAPILHMMSMCAVKIAGLGKANLSKPQITSLQETESRNYLVMINKQFVECLGTLG